MWLAYAKEWKNYRIVVKDDGDDDDDENIKEIKSHRYGDLKRIKLGLSILLIWGFHCRRKGRRWKLCLMNQTRRAGPTPPDQPNLTSVYVSVCARSNLN